MTHSKDKLGLTEFGKEIRKARIDVNQTLTSMANYLDISPSFLCALEMGRKKIPNDFVKKVEQYFSQFDSLKPMKLGVLADISNSQVYIGGLNPLHQRLVSIFARASLDDGQLDRIQKIIGVK